MNKLKIYIISIISIASINSVYCDVVARGSNRVVGVARSGPIPSKSNNSNVSNTTVNQPIQVNNTDNSVVQPQEELKQSETIKEEVKEPDIIEDKSDDFSSVLTKESSVDSDSSSNSLKEKIKAQRAMLDMPDTKNVQYGTGANFCDMNLRKCMVQKCGNDFLKCSLDSDTIWGDKMESCKRDSKCSGQEYTKLSIEIKADRDQNILLSSYNETVNCGIKYTSCMIEGCGTKFEKCLSRKDSQKVISDCESINKECKAIDSGLTARFEESFASIRTKERDNVILQEKRLYELRDKMKTTCNAIGAMFDERTLDCVFTASFYANNIDTPMSSKKVYAGSSFSCTPEYFGIDITTYKENAYRETRAAKSATSSFLGAGLGTAAGAITSGAINRAIDKFKAEKQLAKLTGKSEEDIKINNDMMSKNEYLVKQELGEKSNVKEIKNEEGLVTGIVADGKPSVVVNAEDGDVQSLIRYKDKKYNEIEEHNLAMFEKAGINKLSKKDKITWNKTLAGNITEIRVNDKVVSADEEIEEIEKHNLELLSKVPLEDLDSGRDTYKTTRRGKIIEVSVDGKVVARSDKITERDKTELSLSEPLERIDNKLDISASSKRDKDINIEQKKIDTDSKLERLETKSVSLTGDSSKELKREQTIGRVSSNDEKKEELQVRSKDKPEVRQRGEIQVSSGRTTTQNQNSNTYVSGETTVSTLNGEEIQRKEILNGTLMKDSSSSAETVELVLHDKIKADFFRTLDPYEIDIKVYIDKNIKTILKEFKNKFNKIALIKQMDAYQGYYIVFNTTRKSETGETIEYLNKNLIPQVKKLKNITYAEISENVNLNKIHYDVGVFIKYKEKASMEESSCLMIEKTCEKFLKDNYPEYLNAFL